VGVSKATVLFLVTEDWYFYSHRLPIARAARDIGMNVVVVAKVGAYKDKIEKEGFSLIPLMMQRRSKNPLNEIGAILQILKIYRKVKPDLVHHVALKPVIYGTLAAKLARVPAIINAFAGLGYVFSSTEFFARATKLLMWPILFWLLNRPNSCVLLQNPDDRDLLLDTGIVRREHIRVIYGSGVDTKHFSELPEPVLQPVVVTLVSRMLRDKGIMEFVEATKILKSRGVPVRSILVGKPDPENPTSIKDEQLRCWHSEGVIEWWGQQEDILSVWKCSNIAVLPSSYGEGVPKSLIEASSCARSIVTTDTPGCREIVQHEKNGLLVPVKNIEALADAIQRLIENPVMRRQFGLHGRKFVQERFDEKIVVKETMAIYRLMLTNNAQYEASNKKL